MTDDVPSLITSLEPAYPGYRRTEDALGRMLTNRSEQSETLLPVAVLNLKAGQIGPDVRLLNQRLSELSYLPSPLIAPIQDSFDERTSDALRRFRQDHGLPAGDTMTSETRLELNVPIERRIEQLTYTLERWRWAPHHFARGPIVVNIPEFRVRAYDSNGNVQLSMAVIVGKAGHKKSPMLQADLERIILHPYWNVPARIASHEIEPLMKRDPSYLRRHGFEMVGRYGRIAHDSEGDTIRLLSNGTLRLRQVPGAQNALGNLKFEFPNAFDVYMHGTPNSSLFANTRRDFSHGCIRVEAPESLAVWVLQQQKDSWDRARLEKALASPATQAIQLDQSIPVLIVYGTGFASEDGSLKFLDDIYGYDASLKIELARISTQREHDDHIPWSPFAIAVKP
jgi:murein L,D-transpeptidase YcbB/YkuD